MALTRPIYLDLSPEPVEAIYHPVEKAGAKETAVLICPPWGWDEVASYRGRRDWARQLAAAGHPTLRFGLPATGNSAGSPGDPGRVDAWVGAIDGAAEWLRAVSGLRLAVLGLGLGGLLAQEALARGARFEDLILWGAPVSGRAFVREMEAFSRMQTWNGADQDGEPALPDGWLEAGGFVLSRETIESLKSLRPEVRAGDAPGRALLLERDGIGVDEGLRGSFEDAGAAVTVAPGDGWGTLVSHAERTELPAAVGERVDAWLAEGHAAVGAVTPDGMTSTVSGDGTVVAELDELVLDVGGQAVRESAISVPQQFGRAYGILSEPDEEGENDAPFCALFLNAGAVRNIGPNRLWAETARRWAARGVRSLRLDLEGIGESDGTAGRFYQPKFEQQLAVVIDRLQEQGLGDRFLLVGLCSGGYWAFREALSGPRVHTLLLLNSGALEWDTETIDQQREAGKLTHASDPRKWKELLRGEVGFEKLVILARALLGRLGHSVAQLAGRLARRQPVESSLEAALDRLKDAGTVVVMAFSTGEPLFEDLEADGTLAQIERWPNIEVTELPGDDHTLRPIPAQIGAQELLDRELELALERSRRGVSLAR